MLPLVQVERLLTEGDVATGPLELKDPAGQQQLVRSVAQAVLPVVGQREKAQLEEDRRLQNLRSWCLSKDPAFLRQVAFVE